MSTPHTGQGEPGEGAERAIGDADAAPSKRGFVLALRVLAALSALMSLAALWSVEAKQLRHDLQLAVEPSARPGDRLALRALIFRDVDAPEGPTLASAPTNVRLLDAAGRELTRVELQATALSTLDGSLLLPSAVEGALVVEARTRYEGQDLLCRRALAVDSAVPARRAQGREAGALQHLSLGRVHTLGHQPAPDKLLARVVGGACVPGTPCRLLVWVGEPAAAVALVSSASVALQAPPIPVGETEGLVELRLLVQGLDAQVTLQAVRAGMPVAERAVRLPVGLGEVALDARDSIVEREHVVLQATPPPGRAQLTIDAFVGGRWAGVSTHAAGEQARVELPTSWLSPGLVRVQARADRLSADGSGARVLYVRAPGQDDALALAQIAALLANDPSTVRSDTDRWASELPSALREQPQQGAAFLLAAAEQLRMPVPLAASGRKTQLLRLDHTRALFRFSVAGALALSAFVIALSIARRGLLAADQAQAILDRARDDASEEDGESRADPYRELLGQRFRVLLLALAVAAAFLAAALLIAAKPLWF